MANTRIIKQRISASQNIAKITKAMEMVAASKMKKAQEQATAARPYSHALQASLEKVSAHTPPGVHPLLTRHETGKDIAILVSTDKGLCGSLNTILFKTALHWQKEHPTGEFIIIGRKAVAFSRIAGLKVYAQFTDLPERISTRDILPISSLVMDRYLAVEFRSVSIIYMDFINTLTQKLRQTQLLPVESEAGYTDETMVSAAAEGEYIFEPNPRAILDQLLPYYIENTLYHVLLEGRASEHSARMVAMKNASENASDLVGELKLLFNKTRQAAITSELLDITTAAMTVA